MRLNMSDKIIFTDCCLGAESTHDCDSLEEALRWATQLLDGDRAVPVRIVMNDKVIWDASVDDEDILYNLLEKEKNKGSKNIEKNR
jgi:hypothetical protein